MNSFYIQSDKENCYHYNFNTGIFTLISPVIFKIDSYLRKGNSETKVLTMLSTEYKLTFDEIKSYLNQYHYLEQIDSQYTVNEEYDVRLTPNMIESALCNVRQITFEVTDACNLKCKYCGYGELYQNYDIRTNKNLSIKQAENLIEYLSKYWEKKENLSEGEIIYISFYGGEPLLNMPFIKSIVQTFCNLNLKRSIQYSMTTNAILLKRDIDYLVSHDFHLLISLDGDKYNNSYRMSQNGKGSFDIVYNNAKYIQEKYPQFFKDNVQFNSVIHNRNSVKDILDFFKNEFDKTPTIGELNLNGIRNDKKEDFKSLYRYISQSIDESPQKRALEIRMKDKDPFFHSLTLFIQRHNITTYSDYNSLFAKEEKRQSMPTGTCIPFSKKIFVTVNGKILPCERIGQKYSLGNVTDKKVEINLEGICEQYNNWLTSISKQCETCYMRRACQQCIFNLPNINKPFCLGYTNKENFRSFLQRAVSYIERNPHSYHYIMKDIILR